MRGNMLTRSSPRASSGVLACFLLIGSRLAAAAAPGRSGRERKTPLGVLSSHEDAQDTVSFLQEGFRLRSHSLRSRSRHGLKQAATTSLGPVTYNDTVKKQFFDDAQAILDYAGISTSAPPEVNFVPTGPPGPFQKIAQLSQEPLDTRLGAVITEKLVHEPTKFPPPSQGLTDQEFVAQCPMISFGHNISISAPRCGSTMGSWIDPSPEETRTVLRWYPHFTSGLIFGVDSILTGPGSAVFSEVTEVLSLKGNKFKFANCLGTLRWGFEEQIFKITSMGRSVESSVKPHDIHKNREAYFFQYRVFSADDVEVARSTLYRMGTDQVNFTAIRNGFDTGILVAVGKKNAQWKNNEWDTCTKVPRTWNVNFPQDHKDYDTIATCQDLRVAIASAMTLMAYRDESRGTDGLNSSWSWHEVGVILGSVAIGILTGIIFLNFFLVFCWSEMKDRWKTTLFDFQLVALPKRPLVKRVPPFFGVH